MAPFATPPHPTEDDAAERVHAVTHRVDQLLRQPTASMAPYRATARRWLDHNLTEVD